jgi:hypothetical protein
MEVEMSNWIDEALYDGKPPVGWVDSYVRGDGGFVDGHFRTGPNESIADNLGADIDSDCIPGFFDADADGDGFAEALDLDGDGIVDMIDTDGDGIADTLLDALFG